jgi:type II secretory ATPase GspE/PulE/Tfp pilus assembly ATPase PilB-like protein
MTTTTTTSGPGAAPEPGSARAIDLTLERENILGRLSRLSPAKDAYASEFVDSLLDFAHAVGTSDVHVQPTRVGIEVKFRNDGVLQTLGTFPLGANSSIISRLKVMARLLTYQSEVPQEGRIESPNHGREIRVSTFPTLYGERGVLRFFGHDKEYTTLDELGNPAAVTRQIREALLETSGAILITGPAGSGKSTTLYACLRHLVDSNKGSRSIVSIEDPIEVPVEGVAQSQVNIGAGFDLKTGLRSLMRQDPEVIIVGEIRDRDTAEFAIQASLTGQLLLATFHADTATTAVTRLIEMQIEPFLVRSGLITVINQRLLRALCVCAKESTKAHDLEGMDVERVRVPVGCMRCNRTGYFGRLIISEYLDLRNAGLGSAILMKSDSRELYRLAIGCGMVPLAEQAAEIVRQGKTSPAEVRRVLGSGMRT